MAHSKTTMDGSDIKTSKKKKKTHILGPYLLYIGVLNSVLQPAIIQGVTGGTDNTSGGCPLGQTIPI
jgi:hypothetical protein